MAADTVDIVANAVASAEEGMIPDSEPIESSSEESTTVVDDFSGSEGGSGETAAAVSPSSAAAIDGRTPDLKTAVQQTPQQTQSEEDLREMARHGIHPPKPGAREGTFKWSKVQKVLENARIKVAAKYEPQIKERDTQITHLTTRLKNMDAVDHMILNDPDRYIRTLAAIHPQLYGKFIGQGGQPAGQARTAAQPAVEMPPPDAQFADGSWGYSPEGLQKLGSFWTAQAKQAAVEEVKAEYEKRFGPMEKDYKQRELDRLADERRESLRPGVREQIANAKKQWGPLLKAKIAGDPEDDPRIIQAMDDHPTWSFEACVNHVLLPELQASREKMRAGIMEEIKKAPAAASRTTPGSGGGGGLAGTRSTADIVAEAVRAASGGV